MSEDLKTKLSKEKNLTSAEADRVLDRAAELMVAAEGHGHLSKADLKEGAAEVGIDPRYVDEAIAAVRREEEDEKRAAARNKKRVMWAAVTAAVLFVGTGAVARLSLGSKMAEVDQRRAQLENVIERADAVKSQLVEVRKGSGADTAEVMVRLMDELSGSQNRIATEKKRYNDAVVAYDSAASTPPISWLRPLTGMPAKVPPRGQ